MKSQGRSCEGKERLTREQAREVLREIHARNARMGSDKHHVNAYRCDFCGTHHVGHTSAPKQPPYKRKRRIEYNEYYPEQSPEESAVEQMPDFR